MTVQTVADVTPVLGADVIPGDRLRTENGWSSPIAYFTEVPPGTAAAARWGARARIPYTHDRTPIARPLRRRDLVAIKTREVA